MAVDFSKDPSATGFFAPMRFEAEVFDCEVRGQIPGELNGAFYRLGWDWAYPPKHPEHDALPFNGDGYMGMFRIANGSCDYRGRYVRTERYLANRKARRQLFGVYRNRYTDDPSVQHLNRTVANTAPYVHAGKLFALKEDALPIEMDPSTLDTKGFWDFNGKYKSQTFTAHPKRDYLTGDMICYGYEATGELSDDVFVYVVDKSGNVKNEVRFKAPIVSMMHDMALTEKHIIFNTCGFITNVERLKAGKVHWGWNSSVPTYVGILPRDGDGKDIRWFKGPERAAIHLLNAQSQGNKVTLYAPASDGNPFPQFPQIDDSPWDPRKAVTTMRRWTFDLGSKKDTWEEEIVFPQITGTLPRMDDRYLGRPSRYGFVSYPDTSKPFDEARAGNFRGRVNNSIARMDFATGKVTSYFAGDVHALQEVQFIPRRKDAPEGEGYLVAVASNFADVRSELVIVDAQRLEEVARVILPFRINSQVHGWWVDADELPFVDV